MDINTSFDKAKAHPAGHGYDARTGGFEPSSIIVHATHGNPGTKTENEARFLRDSADVSAHYLIGRDGAIYQILDPVWRAWHAGSVRPVIFANNTSVGIELHAATTEPITNAQHVSLTKLVRYLMARYRIGIDMIATHRSVAIDRHGRLGRKTDPYTWKEVDFNRWRQTLAPAAPSTDPDSAPPPADRVTEESTILAPPRASVAQALAYCRKRGSVYGDFDLQVIVNLFWQIASPAGVDPLVAIGQSIHETSEAGRVFSSWWAQRPRRNPAGIGVTGRTQVTAPPHITGWQWDARSTERKWRQGLAFRSWDEGIRAQVGRLLLYAQPVDAEPTAQQQALRVFALGIRPLDRRAWGSAPAIKQLGQAHNPSGMGWASPGPGYGVAIAAIANAIQEPLL